MNFTFKFLFIADVVTFKRYIEDTMLCDQLNVSHWMLLCKVNLTFKTVDVVVVIESRLR